MKSTLDVCRACGAPHPYRFLQLGAHPPANMFVPPKDARKPQPSMELNVQACLSCGLVQIADQIPRGFYDHYLYVPSGADTMRAHFDQLAQGLVGMSEGGLIVDIGSNDGLLLSHCNSRGGRTLGIDPAANLALAARERGVDVHVGLFNPATAAEVRKIHGPASIIVTTNTLNHIDDLADFMRATETLLSDEGTLVIETPHAQNAIGLNEFDTIYHEHLSTFSLLSIQRLVERFGMFVSDVRKLSVHGGSMRVFVRRMSVFADRMPVQTSAVDQMIAEERQGGMLKRATYSAFADRVAEVRARLVAILNDLGRRKVTIAAYGASARGNTVLNYCRIGPSYLSYVADRNPLKQGLLTPGMLVPVVAPEEIERRPPDVLLILAWNFFDEIKGQLAPYARKGGRFLLPLPEPTLIDGASVLEHAG